MKERFWAKTGKGELNQNGQPKYHPVICHLADTAAVAIEILRSHLSSLALKHLEKGLNLQGESLIRFCGFMAGSHDLGKVSPAFQFQVSEVGKILAGETLYDCWSFLPRERQKGKAPHGLVTAATLPDFLVESGLGQTLSKRQAKRLASKLAAIVGGHHGFFPSQQEIGSLDSAIAGTDERSVWRQYSRQIFVQLWDFVGLKPEDLPNHCDNAAAMLLAGLTTVSDWLASNPEPDSGFPYANDTPFAEYAEELAEKAKNALAKQGWTKQPSLQPLHLTQLFPFISEPRELQKTAVELSENLSQPCLMLVEALMGEGKTEVALYLADLWQHQGFTGGFYIGLPTQATSNAMFKRVQDFLKQRYPQETINLTLSHSAAVLKEDYRQTVCRLDQVYDEDKRVVASEWHTARKRTLLSPYGVGTIDQGLMGIVRSRHQFVRLFGLAGRTVILDEIHAYDIYTSTLLERFLEWLALLGSPVVALSATLPKNTRQRLLDAYARGCGCTEPKLTDNPYPRLTLFSPAGLVGKSFTASGHLRRQLGISWVKDEAWIDSLRERLKDGGCVAVICSTIDRAQAVFQRLQSHFPAEELGLFHGRFLFVNREKIEKECLDKFGKDGTRPKRFILVATQVIEQSLDVDFDLMVSDLAPIDLLLQRSGRLHRHIREYRPKLLQNPPLWLIEPTWDEKGKIQFNDSGYIYDRHVLLRSWLSLRNRDTIQLPEETDSLIESVYNLELEIPSNLEDKYVNDWQSSLEKYQTDEEENKRTKANQIKLPPPTADVKPDQFTRRGEEDDDSTIATLTRLGEPSVTTIFLQQTQSGLILPGSDYPIDLEETPKLETIQKLLAHSTRISKRGLVSILLSQRNPETWTSALLRHCRCVILNDAGVAQIEEWQLDLDPLLGVIVIKNT
jgi:CRISPR-associated endonuclease/helicase Cas3